MLKPILSKNSVAFLAKRPPKHARQITGKIIGLCEEPHPPDSKLLHGSPEGYLRADVGEYRIIYLIEGDNLEVHLIGKRNDDEVYRRFARR